MTDRRGRSHPPQCTTSREDSQILRMTVTDRSVASRTVAQNIQSITPHSVHARTIRHRLQQSGLSARRPLLCLPLTQNHGRLRRQWCDERMWAAEWNEVVFADELRICLQQMRNSSDSSLETPWRKDAEQLRYAPPHWSCTGYYGMGRYWISFSHSSSTYCRYFKQPALHLRDVGASCPSLTSISIFQQDNARPYVARIVQRFFVNHPIELLPWPARSPDHLPIENMWYMVAQRLTQIISLVATPD
ncbi:transposable element Tcb1 transposase [Trichonephila clavipes]|nr:transposable element Tcb1 transposase [Trichonephila clavipes]